MPTPLKPRPYACEECGEEHNKCIAHKKSTGGPCNQPPIEGTDVCRLHGGKAPQVQEAARIRGQERATVEAVRVYGLPRNIDPHQALREEIARTAGHVDWLSEIVANLNPEELTDGIVEQVTATTQGDEKDERMARVVRRAAPNIWLDLYQRERRHLIEVCKVAIACGLAEREVGLLEEQGRIIASIFRGLEVDAALAFSPEMRQRFREAAARHLRAVPELGA